MPMLPSPICPLAGQSIFGQNVVCGSMTHLPSARSTEECHLIRSFFQVLCFDHRLACTYPIRANDPCAVGNVGTNLFLMLYHEDTAFKPLEGDAPAYDSRRIRMECHG